MSYWIIFHQEIKQTKILSKRESFVLVIIIQFLEGHSKFNRKRTPVAGDKNRFQTQEKTTKRLIWNASRTNTHSRSIFVSNLSQERNRECFQHIGVIFHERSDCSQNLTASLQIQKSLFLETKWTWQVESPLLFTILHQKWRRSRATESLEFLSGVSSS